MLLVLSLIAGIVRGIPIPQGAGSKIEKKDVQITPYKPLKLRGAGSFRNYLNVEFHKDVKRLTNARIKRGAVSEEVQKGVSYKQLNLDPANYILNYRIMEMWRKGVEELRSTGRSDVKLKVLREIYGLGLSTATGTDKVNLRYNIERLKGVR